MDKEQNMDALLVRAQWNPWGLVSHAEEYCFDVEGNTEASDTLLDILFEEGPGSLWEISKHNEVTPCDC